jgi:hypothetical protein
MTKRTRYFMTGSAAVLAAGVCTGLIAYYGGGFQPLVASTGPDELRYLPKSSSVLVYADVKGIMQSELRQRFKQAAPLPMSEQGQEEFYEHTGIRLDQDVDYVVGGVTVGAPDMKSGVLIARGRFDVVRLEGLAREHGAEVQEYKGKRLLVLDHSATREGRDPAYVDSDKKIGALAFLEPGLVGIGDLVGVQRAIDAQLSAESITSNEEMMSLVRDIVRDNNAWAVGRFDLIASQTKLPDQIARQIPPIKWLAVAGHVNGGVTAQIRAEANDPEAAKNLQGVINGVMSFARLQGQNDPKLTAFIQSLQLTSQGTTVQLSFTVPAEIFELMAPKVQ